MDLDLRRPALALVVLLAAACEKPKPTPKPNPILPLLARHETLEADLIKAQASFLHALEAYEQKKHEYQRTVAAEMERSKGDKRTISQVQEMANDGSRIATELLQGVQQANEALVS